MAGKPGRPKKNSVKAKQTERKKCLKCEVSKHKQDQFYSSLNPLHADGKVPYCKDCLRQMVVDKDGYIDVELVKEMLRQIDKPFISDVWDNSKGESERRHREVIGLYMKNISLGYKEQTYKDSVFINSDDTGYSKMFEDEEPKEEKKFKRARLRKEKTQEEWDELEDKWGYGYSRDELLAFEKKYQLLKNNYDEKTRMHTEALLTYIRYRVKEEISTAEGNIDNAKKWGELASKAATSAKINPSQLSKSDLSDGLSTFSELSQAVEREVDVIRILPQLKARPNDALDFNIWCYINYARHLKGMPPCTYEEVYSFYDRSVEEYIKQYGDPYGIFEQDMSKQNRDKIKQFIKDV